jgi:hypothetical protein
MEYEKQWVIESLRRLGYGDVADEAERVLPSEVPEEELLKFADKNGISRGELISRMGGSP